jgi:serine palmitoyltransferase
VTPILPIHAGRPTMAAKLSYALRRLGILATPVAVPAVKFWEIRVRVTLSADFSDDQVNKLVDCTIEASRSCGIVKNVKARRQIYSYTGNEFTAEDEQFQEDAECFKTINGLIECDISTQPCSSSSKRTFERNCGAPVRRVGHTSRASYGLGSSGSRWVTGTFAPHLKVERTLADYTQQEAAMTFANAEIGLSSTIAALCRPLLSYKHHYMLVPSKGHETIEEGLRIASRKEKPEIVTYDDFEEMFTIMSRSTGRKTYFTVYIDTITEGKLIDPKMIVSRLQRHKGQSGMTLLLDDSKGLGQHGPDRLGITGCMDLRSTAQTLDAQILVYGSFYQAFGLSGGFLAGSDVLIQELRFTSRGYMFSTSPQPYVMQMVKKALEMRMNQGQK